MYLYYSKQGELLEFINDKSLQQYNAADYNKLYVYIDDGEGDGLLPSSITALTTWFERVSGTPIALGDILPATAANEEATSIAGTTVGTITIAEIPFDRTRDLKYFKYGMNYQFFVVELPADVRNTSGVYAMSGQVVSNGIPGMVLGPAVFTIKRSAIIPDKAVTLSQYQYLLANTRKGTAVFEGRVSVSGFPITLAPETLESYDDAVCVNDDSAENPYVAKVPGIDVPRAGDLFIYFYETANSNGQKTALFVVNSIPTVESQVVDGDLMFTVTMDLEPVCFFEGKDAAVNIENGKIAFSVGDYVNTVALNTEKTAQEVVNIIDPLFTGGDGSKNLLLDNDSNTKIQIVRTSGESTKIYAISIEGQYAFFCTTDTNKVVQSGGWTQSVMSIVAPFVVGEVNQGSAWNGILIFNVVDYGLIAQEDGSLVTIGVAASQILTTKPQTLTAEQQAQIWANLGLSNGDIVEY